MNIATVSARAQSHLSALRDLARRVLPAMAPPPPQPQPPPACNVSYTPLPGRSAVKPRFCSAVTVVIGPRLRRAACLQNQNQKRALLALPLASLNGNSVRLVGDCEPRPGPRLRPVVWRNVVQGRGCMPLPHPRPRPRYGASGPASACRRSPGWRRCRSATTRCGHAAPRRAPAPASGACSTGRGAYRCCFSKVHPGQAEA